MASCVTNAVDAIACEPGVLDCCTIEAAGLRSLLQCAPYNGKFLQPESLHWLMISAFLTMAMMSFGIGANDAANSWGTSVGSGAVSLNTAVIVGGLMDWLGATVLGAGVSDTIQNISDIQGPSCWACGYCDSKISLFMLGMCATLLATAAVLLLSSFTSMPVSTTHAVIGAVIGVALVGTSSACLHWVQLSSIAASWITSPLIAGVIGASLHVLLQKTVMMAPDSDQRALRACPWLFAITMSSVSCLVIMKSPVIQVTWMWTYGIVVLIFGLTLALAHFYVVPVIQKRIASSSQTELRGAETELATLTAMGPAASPHHVSKPSSHEIEDSGTLSPTAEGAEITPKAASSSLSDASPRKSVRRQQTEGEGMIDAWAAVLPHEAPPATPSALPGMYAGEQYTEQQQHALFVFRYLLVFVASLESFAHGANDTANATGAFTAVWTSYRNGLESCEFGTTPLWIMALGGLFVCLGVYFLGHRVIRTIGFGIANVNFLRGFCIELSSALSVVVATMLNLPVSTTHCQVGAVIFVGLSAFGPKHVQWNMFGWIALTWVVTLPLSATISAVLLVAGKVLIIA